MRDDALLELERVARADVKGVGSRVRLAGVYLRGGRQSDAVRVLREVLAIEPGHEGAARALASVPGPACAAFDGGTNRGAFVGARRGVVARTMVSGSIRPCGAPIVAPDGL